MNNSASDRPSICLNMIVRNEAHIVHEVLDSVAPYITSWVIVDTGSDDGTQDVIRKHMERLGIDGNLYERRWQDFGTNRSEALALAQGRADYIWIIDADDLLVGAPDFGKLREDAYEVRYGEGAGFTYWRKQIFRNGLPFRYEGIVHEYYVCDVPYVEGRLDGDYFIDSRRLGGRNQDPQKYARDAELLLAEHKRDPSDPRTVFYLAQSYFDMGDFVSARKYYAKRAEMAGWDEETFFAKLRVAESMHRIEESWAEVQDAYLKAWEFRPTRAEPLHAIAYHYRISERYGLGHLFAERAAAIPLPDDTLFVASDVHLWRSLDEQAVCGSWLGKHHEVMTICRKLLARPDIPDEARQRIAANRDVAVPAMIEEFVQYPETAALRPGTGSRDAEVTATLIAGPNRDSTERTLNSFLHSCLDAERIGRFVAFDVGLSPDDRAALLNRYQFLEFAKSTVPEAPDARLTQIRAEVGGRLWLHVDSGWGFFAAERFIDRLVGVLDAEPTVIQVAINLDDARTLTGRSASENDVRRTAGGGRYVLATSVARGPALFDTARLDRYEAGLGTAPEALSATLDEVLCITEI